MNAQGVRDNEHLEQLFDDPNYIAQEKLDGMRTIVHITSDGLRIFSRSAGVADPTRPLEKTSALPHLAEIKFPKIAGTIIDAELASPGVDSAKIAGTVHRKHIQPDYLALRIMAFDILAHCGINYMNKPYHERIIALEDLNLEWESSQFYVLNTCYTPESKRALYESVLADGGEGVIFKNLNATYIQGTRPGQNWYKAKKSAKFDCVVMGFTKGMGKYNNRIGAVKFGQYVNGKLTELGQASGMSDKERMQMSTSPGYYIGKVVTIKGMERLKSGAIRHPQYDKIRYDKNPRECIWYMGEQ